MTRRFLQNPRFRVLFCAHFACLKKTNLRDSVCLYNTCVCRIFFLGSNNHLNIVCPLLFDPVVPIFQSDWSWKILLLSHSRKKAFLPIFPISITANKYLTFAYLMFFLRDKATLSVGFETVYFASPSSRSVHKKVLDFIYFFYVRNRCQAPVVLFLLFNHLVPNPVTSPHTCRFS